MRVKFTHINSDHPYTQYVEGDDWDTLERRLSYFKRNNRIVKSITDNRGRTINIKRRELK